MIEGLIVATVIGGFAGALHCAALWRAARRAVAGRNAAGLVAGTALRLGAIAAVIGGAAAAGAAAEQLGAAAAGWTAVRLLASRRAGEGREWN